MTDAEIAEELHISERNIPGIVTELVQVRLWNRDESGTVWLAKFEEETTPSDPRAADRMRKFRAQNGKKTKNVTPEKGEHVTDSYAVTKRNVTGEQNVTLRHRGERGEETYVTNVTLSDRRKVEVTPGPTFNTLEPDVLAFLATVAAENKSGMLSEGRIATLRREISEALSAIGSREAMAHGLREAVKHGAGSVNYAKKAAKSYKPGGDRQIALAGDSGRKLTGWVPRAEDGLYVPWEGTWGKEPVGYGSEKPLDEFCAPEYRRRDVA